MRYALLALLLLAGCASTQSTVEAALPKYRGKPVGLIFQKWGAPDRTIPADGATIYQWQVSSGGRTCRLEAHADSHGAGGQPTVMGIRGVGDDSVCGTWYRML